MNKSKLAMFEWELAQMRDHVRTFAEKAITEVIPDHFWAIPPSSSGKHHPTCTHRLGGLIVHTKRVGYVVHQLCEAAQNSQEDKEALYCAAILHDIGKKDKYEKGTNDYERHPLIAVELIKEKSSILATAYGDGGKDFLNTVCRLITYHMGPWTPEECRKPLDKYDSLELTLYYADYLASRKMLGTPVDGIIIPEEFSKLKKPEE